MPFLEFFFAPEKPASNNFLAGTVTNLKKIKQTNFTGRKKN